FPEGVFSVLLLGSKGLEPVIRNESIDAVALTGSVSAGREVASIAGRALKKCVLELGGSDPYVILEDAHLKEAARTCAESRLINSGQSCIAAKRFIVVDAVRAEFEELLREALQKPVMGDPLAPETELGPLAREDLRETLHEQVRRSIEMGARCSLGGEVPSGG